MYSVLSAQICAITYGQSLSSILQINLLVKILLVRSQLIDILNNLKEKPDVATLLLVILIPLAISLEAWIINGDFYVRAIYLTMLC